MKENPVGLFTAWIFGSAAKSGSLVGLGALLFAGLVAFALGCVTPLPRPNQTPSATPIQSPTTTPIHNAVALVPASTMQMDPTPTAPLSPTSSPTEVPGPGSPTAAAPPTSVPTDDAEGLRLQVYAPEDGATVPGSTIVVYGQTSLGARVFVSGEETDVDAQGGFRADVFLVPAENELVIVAMDEAGKERTVLRTVTSLALPFLLLVTEPENESIVSASSLPISGRTGPNAILSINGRSVLVDRFGYFSSTVQLDEGPNIIDVVATNDDGRTLSTVLAVIYRAPGG